MRREPDTQPDSPAAVADEVSPRSPWRVASVEALPGHRLRVVFLDGLTGTVDLAPLVHSPHAGVFAALMDEALFAQVRLEHGAVAWPGELDLAPDVMYDSIREHGEWRL